MCTMLCGAALPSRSRSASDRTSYGGAITLFQSMPGAYRRAGNGSKRGTTTGCQIGVRCYNGTVTHTVTSSVASWRSVRFVLCDLDGVVWLARRAIPGAPEALEAIGVPAAGDVVTSAQAGASLVAAGETVLVAGGAGLVEAVEARGAIAVREGAADAVVVGLHDDFDYWRLHAASAAVRAGARFIATNDDASFPTPDGPIPGAGAIVAAVATAAGVAPIVAGKPHPPMAALVAARCGPGFAPAAAIVVGDRPSTDGLFALTIGCPFSFVRSGVFAAGATPDADVAAALDVADLAAVAEQILRG